MTDELASIIFKDEGWILDRYDVTSGHNPLPFFDRVNYVILYLLLLFNFLERGPEIQNYSY